MTIHKFLMNSVQEDARRAGERDRLVLEARRALMAGRPRPDPAAPAGRLARLRFRRAASRRAADRPAAESAHRAYADLSPGPGRLRNWPDTTT